MNASYRLALVALAVVLARPVIGQTAVAGTWIAGFEHNLRNVNGEITADTGKARIVFEVRGDSVFGTWTVLSPQTTPMPVPRKLRGTFSNSRVRVSAEPVDAVMNEDGNETRVKMVATYDFAVNGDRLAGTAEIKSPGSSMPRLSRPFAAEREKR